uniref:Uncharacterized protein n=1 Tax=Yersinia pestis TaxID=632 RepID=A0A0K1H0K1_YERPE|nr:DUF4054 domain-containing protein [Yersinia pestis]AKT73159.1 hypothetical protein [Yersinia pestis]
MVEDFLARYPEFKNVDTGQLSLALEDAALEVSAPVWGKLHQKGGFLSRGAPAVCRRGDI